VRLYVSEQSRRASSGETALPELVAFNAAHGGRGSLVHYNQNGILPEPAIEGLLDSKSSLWSVTEQVLGRIKDYIADQGKEPLYCHFHSAFGADTKKLKAAESIDIWLLEFTAMIKSSLGVSSLKFATSYVMADRADFAYKDLHNNRVDSFKSQSLDEVTIIDYSVSGLTPVYGADDTHVVPTFYRDFIAPELWDAFFYNQTFGEFIRIYSRVNGIVTEREMPLSDLSGLMV